MMTNCPGVNQKASNKAKQVAKDSKGCDYANPSSESFIPFIILFSISTQALLNKFLIFQVNNTDLYLPNFI